MSYNQIKTEEINSRDYWDNRFRTDWKERGGIEQSAFFSKIAAENVPSWLKGEIQGKRYHVCDWGCAFGDGTNSLKNQLNIDKITGVDFSAAAIEYAKEAYPDIDFIAADFTKKLPAAQYDILFTSNTLEHFEDPWRVLNKISSIATAHVVVLVPFKEYERFEEHFYTFDFNNIPVSLSNGFVLTHSSVTNTGLIENNYWPGKQVLLIFSSPDLLKSEKRTLAEISLESVSNQKDLVNQLNKEISYQLNLIGRLTDGNNDWQKTISAKEDAINELQKILSQKNDLVSKFETALLQADEKHILYREREDLLIKKEDELRKQENKLGELNDRIKQLEEELKKNENEAAKQASSLWQENMLLKNNQNQQSLVNDQLHKEIVFLLGQLSYANSQENEAVKKTNRVEGDLSLLRQQYQSLSSDYTEILNSRSWRYTRAIKRPLHYLKRMVAGLKGTGVKKKLRKIVPPRPVKSAKVKTRIESIPAKDVFSGNVLSEPVSKNDDKKRICFLVKEFNSGGLERVVFDLALRLQEKNFTTSILIAGQGGKIELEARNAGIEVFLIYDDIEKIHSFIQTWQPDIVFNNHCYFGVEAFSNAGISVVEIIHNAYFWQKNNHYCLELREKHISHFVAVSHFVKQYSVEHLGISNDNISIINNGLNLDGFIRPPRYLRNIIETNTQEQFTFILSANFRPSKCHYTAVEALKIVHRRFPATKLQFAGGVDDENLYQLLRNKVLTDGLENQVEFLGLLNRRQLSHVMLKVQAAILPSSYEGFSISTLEYMFFGLPMILTDVGAARDVIHDGDTGLIIPPPIALDKMDNERIAETGMHPRPENIQKLADAMIEIIANSNTWKQKGQVAAERTSQFTVDAAVGKYVTIIEKTLSRSKG